MLAELIAAAINLEPFHTTASVPRLDNAGLTLENVTPPSVETFSVVDASATTIVPAPLSAI
jgi:hypothetical protein